MSLIVFASAKGAPGVSTTTLALATHWPRPALVVEADLSGSSIIPGYLRGQIHHDRGINHLAIAHNSGALEEDFEAQTLPLDRERPDGPRFVPGLFAASGAPAARELWGPLASHLASFSETDVLVDLGRLDAVRDSREAFLSLADLVLITTSARLPDWFAARQLVQPRVQSLPGGAGSFTNLRCLVIGPGRPYPTADVAGAVGLRAVGSVAWDPDTAAVYSDGAGARTGKYSKSAFAKSITRLTADIDQHLSERADQMIGANR